MISPPKADTVNRMLERIVVFSVFCLAAWAQQAPNPGVSPNVLLNNSQVRVSRVEVQPGAARSMHTHDDVRFHLFLPITGNLELTVGSQAPVAATPGHATYIEKGTMHGFKNTGNSLAMVYEVFVYLNAPPVKAGDQANLDSDALALALAFASTKTVTGP